MEENQIIGYALLYVIEKTKNYILTHLPKEVMSIVIDYACIPHYIWTKISNPDLDLTILYDEKWKCIIHYVCGSINLIISSDTEGYDRYSSQPYDFFHEFMNGTLNATIYNIFHRRKKSTEIFDRLVANALSDKLWKYFIEM